MGSEKIGIDDLIYRAEIETQVENKHGHQEEKWGGRMIWEIRTDMYTLPCVKQLVGSFYLAQGAQPNAV